MKKAPRYIGFTVDNIGRVCEYTDPLPTRSAALHAVKKKRTWLSGEAASHTRRADLFQQRGINWNNEPVRFKRGSCIVKNDVEVQTKDGRTILRPKWAVDYNIPIFSKEKDYIESRLRPASRFQEVEAAE